MQAGCPSNGGSLRPWRALAPRWLAAFAAIALSVSGCSQAAQDPPRSGRSTDPLRGLKLWVRPDSPAAAQVAIWTSEGDTSDAADVERIAREPTASWLAGQPDPGSIAARLVTTAAARGEVAQLVLYDIPDRDCSSFSSGGAPSGSAYLDWVRRIGRGIGRSTAIVVLEPDAVDQAVDGCVPPNQVGARYRLLSRAIAILRSDPKVHVYLDAGNSDWLPAARMVGPLRRSGVERASGFALNVANFQTTRASVAYGRRIARYLGGRHFVIDTSRNGNGPPADTGPLRWCNPRGVSLGASPTTDTGYKLVDAFLWVKYPGESDGTCNSGDPPAGVWWPSYALGLVRNRS